jgi:hypothetical protein
MNGDEYFRAALRQMGIEQARMFGTPALMCSMSSDLLNIHWQYVSITRLPAC